LLDFKKILFKIVTEDDLIGVESALTFFIMFICL